MDKRQETAIEESQVVYKRVPFILLMMFCGYVFIWYLQVGERWPELGAVRLEFVFGLILVALLPFVGIPVSSPLVKFIVLYLAMVAIQIPFSHAFDHSVNVFWNRVVKFGMMGLFIAAFVKSPRDLKWFVFTFMLAWAKMGQEGVYGVLTGNMMWENQGILRLHGSTSLYHHPNSYSGFAVGVLPFIYYLYPVVGKVGKIGLAVLTVFSINIILFTGSRTGYVALAFFMTVLFMRSRRKKLWAAISLPLLIMAVIFTPVQYRNRFTSIFTLQEAEGNSAQRRIQILKDAWKVFREYPEGVGVGAFPAVREQMFNRVQDTHNLYLEVATNLGVQGFIAFFLFIGALIGILRSNHINLKDQEEFLSEYLENQSGGESDITLKDHFKNIRFMRAICSAMLTFVIVRLALGMFGMDLYEIYWWFAAGTAIALNGMRSVAENRTSEFTRDLDEQKTKGEDPGLSVLTAGD